MHSTVNSFFISTIDKNEINGTIFKLASKKPTDFDHHFAVSLIKNIAYRISKPLSVMTNLCLCTGFFQEILKNTILVQVYKKGNIEAPIPTDQLLSSYFFPKYLKQTLRRSY